MLVYLYVYLYGYLYVYLCATYVLAEGQQYRMRRGGEQDLQTHDTGLADVCVSVCVFVCVFVCVLVWVFVCVLVCLQRDSSTGCGEEENKTYKHMTLDWLKPQNIRYRYNIQ